MNAKQKLQEIIIESFIQDKIGENRFNLMTEKVENITEGKAEKILNEIEPILIGVGLGVGALATYIQIVAARNYVTGKKVCKKQVKSISDPKERKKKLYLCQINVMQKSLQMVKTNKHKCKTEKNPDKCFKMVNKTINYLESQILHTKAKLKNL